MARKKTSDGISEPLVRIGDIAVTASQVVAPSGTAQIEDTTWTLEDFSRTGEAEPMSFQLSNAFGFLGAGVRGILRKKQMGIRTKTQGWIDVTVTTAGYTHTTSVAVSGTDEISDIKERVRYVRSLASTASERGQR